MPMAYLCRHEELYEEVKDVVIRSDGLNQNVPKSIIRQMFDGVTLVLSTLSMLSNPLLTDHGIFKIIPMRSLVIDEASQIDVFEFMVPVLGIFGSKCFVILSTQHLFYKFSKDLKKVCFFGDPRQRELPAPHP